MRALDCVLIFKVSKNKNGSDNYSTILINAITYYIICEKFYFGISKLVWLGR